MKTLLEMPKQFTSNGVHPLRKFVSNQLLVVVSLVLLLLGVHSHALAQGITGSISGTVTDAAGAVIPGAMVKITHQETNEVRTVATSDVGSYTVPQLAPGQYSVRVDKAGFKSYEQKDLTLAINQVVQINAQLVVGAAQQTVVVTGESPVIQTQTSSVGLVVDSQTIQNTPLNGHTSIIGLIALAPGVQGAGAQDQIPVYGITPSIGTGSRNAFGGVGYTLDGATNLQVTLQRGSGEAPPLDAIAEFKTITTGAPAEFNQPSQVVVVTQGGGNQLHGEALEFNRSKGTSAKNFFAGSLPRPPYERNEYGGNLSGPVFIPRLYDGRNRSFFFFSYEGFHLTQSQNVNSQQPTAAERAGNFNGVGTVINPLTGQPFLEDMINPLLFNAVDVKLQNILMPVPTVGGTGTNTFELVPYYDNVRRFSLRMDHRLGEKDQIRGTFLSAFYGPNPLVGTSSLAGGMSGIGEHNTNTIIGWTHIFSPTLLLDTYASYFHLPIYRTPQNSNIDFPSIIPGLGALQIEGAPQISITNVTSIAEQGSKDLEQDVQADAAVTKVLAKHTIKVGGSYLYDIHWSVAAQTPQRGSFSFNGRYTGVAYADFLLGYPSSTGKPNPNDFAFKNLSSQIGMFVQDDFKITPKLTLNAGIRYDLQVFQDNPYGNNSLFVPSVGKVVVFAKSYPSNSIPAFIPNTVLASSVGLPSSLFGYLGQDKNNFAPRLGFAYQVRPDTVLRGAGGIFFNLLPGTYIQAQSGFENLPFVAPETFSQPTGSVPSITMNAPFGGTGAFSANPSAFAEHSPVTPYTEQYNLAIEHQLSRGLDIRIGYVGQHNVKQNNASGPGNTAPNINLANPPVVGVTVQSTNLVQPYSAINEEIAPIFHSNMNSLQIGLHKQYGHGFQLNAEYQWTRVLGTENLENPSGANPNDSYGPIGGITPQVLAVSYSYLLPFGHGQMLFGSAGNVANKFVSGWQLSGITEIQTGQPFSVSYTAPGSPIGLVSGRANIVSGVNLYPSHKTRAQWFNPAAFVAPPTYTLNGVTYATYGNSGYDMLRGPAYQDWDISLKKTTIWKERYRVELRAESFNVFNHPNFATPNAAISNPATVGAITSISSSPSAEARTVEFAVKFSF